MGPGSAAHRRSDAALRPGHESGVFARICLNTVIASAAKQSRIFPQRQSGLLRCARNDGVWVTASLIQFASHLQTRLRILAAGFARALPVSPPMKEGAGKTGCRPGTHGPLCEGWQQKLHSGIQVKPNIRPSLRSGFTAYVALSPGSDALLPPSSREMADARARSGRHITAGT